MRIVGVLGSGTMGTGITETLASNGIKVIWYSIRNKNENVISKIEKSLNKQIDKNKISIEEKQKILSNIVIASELSELEACSIIIEAIIEDIDIKKEYFSQLDKIINEDAILATNTSSLSITEIASATNRPDQVIGMHFFNPAPVMKLIEVIKGIATSQEVFMEIMDFSKEIGKTPIEVQESPGFVVNRLLIPMINEAIGVYADGVAKVEDIDNAMKLGANHPIGPLALADLIGLDICLDIMNSLYEEYNDPKYRPHNLLKKLVRAKYLGRKTKKGFYSY